MTSVVEAAETVAPIAAANADRSERARQLEPEVVAALREADLFRLCVPAGLGGMEASPRELVEAVERRLGAGGDGHERPPGGLPR